MKDSVKNIFPEFSKNFEGYVNWMYLDIKGLVTCGIGNLIDPVSLAISLPFTKKDGSRASQDEIKAEWKQIKGRSELAKQGHKSAMKYCTLRISDEAISNLVRTKLEQNEDYLIKHHFPEFNDWPADAQLAILSMAWALGSNFPATWIKLKAACVTRNWALAALNCHINEVGNAGIKPRNEVNVKLFNSAAIQIPPDNNLSDDEKTRIMNLVALTVVQSLEDIM
jgi:hypothetical protein